MTDIEARVFVAQAVADTIRAAFPDASATQAKELGVKLVDSIVGAYIKLIMLNVTKQKGQAS